MNGIEYRSFIRNTATLTILLILSACLMGEEESDSDEVAVDHELSGSVGDGPVIGASMTHTAQ